MRDDRPLRPFHCRAMSSRPQTQMPCNLQPCLDWYASSWGEVSNMCESITGFVKTRLSAFLSGFLICESRCFKSLCYGKMCIEILMVFSNGAVSVVIAKETILAQFHLFPRSTERNMVWKGQISSNTCNKKNNSSANPHISACRPHWGHCTMFCRLIF